jgi:hypothetical protein
MVAVSIEVHSDMARFVVVIKARSIQQALSIAATQYSSSFTKVQFPIDPESFFIEDPAA